MRRPPIACRRALQSLQPSAAHHIWIPDDLLSTTVNRFFQNASSPQKRHGSHVPGPLEARKRAAKRLMTVPAAFRPWNNFWDSFVSLFRLGSLFGSLNPRPIWKYEPPSLPTNPSTVHSDTQPDTHVVDTSFQNFKTLLGANANQNRRDTLVHAYQACRPDATHAYIFNTMVMEHLAQVKLHPAPILNHPCFASFDVPPTYSESNTTLLGSLEDLCSSFPKRVRDLQPLSMKIAESVRDAQASSGMSQDTTLFRIMRILGRTATPRHTEGHKTVSELLRLVAEKVCAPKSRLTLRIILLNFDRAAGVLRHSVFLAADDSSLLPVAEFILFWIPNRILYRVVPPVTVALAHTAAYRSRLPREIYFQRMHVWLQLLQRRDVTPTGSLLGLSITSLAAFVFPPGQRKDRARFPVLLHALLLSTCQQQANGIMTVERVSELLALGRAQTWERRPSPVIFKNLISRMKEAGLPYQNLADYTLKLVVRYKRLPQIVGYLDAFDSQGVTSSDSTLLISVVDRAINRSRVGPRASRSARQEHARVLHACQQLISILGRIGVHEQSLRSKLEQLRSERQFQHILDCAKEARAMPPAYYSISIYSPVDKRVEFIHQLAHHYSVDTVRTQHQNWRAIYYLYNYVQHNRLPMGPLFTKAVVRASLTRPLSENTFVSARRLMWVCDMVARVEGYPVAKRIEGIFWHWRGDVLRIAREAHLRAGGDYRDRVRVNTIKAMGLI